MYLESWQVFLGGCVIGTLIAFIVLTIIVLNAINRIGIRGIHVQMPSGNNPPEEPESNDDSDLVAKLSFILLNRGWITDDDMEFMMNHITYDEWKESIEHEIAEMEKHNTDGTD